jgi:Uma2 family endonuclease
MTWLEVCADKSLQDLPYKIETNRRGNIIMSPARWEHGRFQSKMIRLFAQFLPTWETIVECPIETTDGVKVADIAAAPAALFRDLPKSVSLRQAPKICVELLSPSNSEEEMMEKSELYFHQGAEEFWVVSEFGQLFFYSLHGQMDQSLLCPDFPSNIESN